MARLNVMKVIEENKRKINTRYDLNVLGVNEILNNSRNSLDLIYNGFVFGYIQGIKASKAEMRKGVKWLWTVCQF